MRVFWNIIFFHEFFSLKFRKYAYIKFNILLHKMIKLKPLHPKQAKVLLSWHLLFLFEVKWSGQIKNFYYNNILLTWAISTSPKGSKYSLSSGSVVFQGNPRTIRSEHLFFSTLLFLATQLSEWSSDFLLSAEKKIQMCHK